jgi:hypothetical protein
MLGAGALKVLLVESCSFGAIGTTAAQPVSIASVAINISVLSDTVGFMVSLSRK